MRRNDPRIRQTLNQISQNLESANLTTQASLFSFSQTYISPCLTSVNTCLEASCQPCFGAVASARERPHHHHHHRRQQRGRESLAFDFYDDWEQDEAEWGNDELDRLLTGNDTQQPGKQVGMSYGGLGRGKGGATKDREEDPNIVPHSSMFGFLERLPWKIGGRGTRYRPGVADLQENMGRRGPEAGPLIGDGDGGRGRHGRSRSDTMNSRSTNNSLSSRGDLFPSEDEDDAVPLDDEFAMVLERRTTTTSDDRSSRRKSGKRPSGSGKSSKSASSKETRSTRKEGRSPSNSSRKEAGLVETTEDDAPSMVDLKHEEERARREEEAQLEERRQAAHRLALGRGLSSAEDEPDLKEPATVQETPILSLSGEEPPIEPPPYAPTLPLESEPSERTSSPSRDPGPVQKPPD